MVWERYDFEVSKVTLRELTSLLLSLIDACISLANRSAIFFVPLKLACMVSHGIKIWSVIMPSSSDAVMLQIWSIFCCLVIVPRKIKSRHLLSESYADLSSHRPYKVLRSFWRNKSPSSIVRKPCGFANNSLFCRQHASARKAWEGGGRGGRCYVSSST